MPVLGHTTTSGTCSRCGLSIGDWMVDYYVDNFNQPTNEGYVINKDYFVGSFSNSATTNSSLYAAIIADEEDVSVFLYEYGRSQVKNSSENYVTDYDITMRTADGTDHSITGTIYCGGDRLFIDEAYESIVIDALCGEGSISFYIVQSDRTTTTCLFTCEASNFAEEYQALA
ncbi:MAG: hypothetical protein ACI3VB_03725 [Oscillospiraceae bacterium]